MTSARLIRRLFPGVILSACVPLVISGAPADANAQSPVGRETEATASILGAKRDLEAIKAVKDAQLFPALTGSSARPALPELRTESGAVPPAALRAVKPEATNPNWLIDGMARTERARRDSRDRHQMTGVNRGSSRISADRDLGRSGTAFGSSPGVGQAAISPLDSHTSRDPREGALAERTDASSLSEADQTKPSGGGNPLTHFLGDWLTPQDYALLRPSLETTTLGGGVRSGDARFLVPGTTDFALASSLQREIPGGFAAMTPIPSEQPSRENPFLETLNRTEFTPPAQITPTPGLPRVGLLPSSAAPVGPTPGNAAVMAPGRPNVPDFPKPGQDEKYFKQLKRF